MFTNLSALLVFNSNSLAIEIRELGLDSEYDFCEAVSVSLDESLVFMN